MAILGSDYDMESDEMNELLILSSSFFSCQTENAMYNSQLQAVGNVFEVPTKVRDFEPFIAPTQLS